MKENGVKKYNSPYRYSIGLLFWDPPKENHSRISQAIKERYAIAKAVPIKYYELFWFSNGEIEGDKPVFGNISFHFWFKTKKDWQKAIKIMDKDIRFKKRDPKRPERYRSYKYTDSIKINKKR